MILAGWLAGSRVGRLLRWSKADAEVQRSDVYLANPGASLQRNRAWGAAGTIRYVVNGQLVETTVVRGFQSGVRPWMEQWARQYPIGSHRRILFDPASPLEADLDGKWSPASFSSPIGYGLAAAILLWEWRRLRVAAANAFSGVRGQVTHFYPSGQFPSLQAPRSASIPPPSTSCAYFPSPQGCTLTRAKIRTLWGGVWLHHERRHGLISRLWFRRARRTEC